MKNFALAATLVAALVAPGLVGVANAASGDDTVFGRDTFALERSLADRGIKATNLEEWGQVIVGTVKNADGTQSNQFFDKDTLQVVQPGGAAVNSGVGSAAAPYGRGEFESSNASLVD